MEKNKALLQTLKKIPIFKGLSPSHVQKVLGLCEAKTFKEKETICAQGSDSDEMFILISGELGVMDEGGLSIATLHPITTVGEMGMFNRHKRSASVEAIKQSKVLVIERSPFEYLLRSEAEMRMRVYQNIVEILSSKIVNDNSRARDYLLNRLRGEKELRTMGNMLDMAVRLLAERDGISTEQVRAQLEEQAGGERLNILVVDDEEPVRQLVRDSLADYAVSEASDGEEALASIRIQRPDLVIADIKMPKMDGFALAEQLRQEFPDLPVIALSGYINANEIEGHNFVGFLEKPMRLDEFRNMIAGALAREI